MNARLRPDHFATADLRTEDDFSLPGWAYWDPEFFELERQVIFHKSWHLVCHVNDVPKAGDYLTFRFLNESILTVRSPDGVVRSFHNVCRHRAARLVEGEQGNCGKRITCPYHAWTYATDGRLVGVPLRVQIRARPRRAMLGPAPETPRRGSRPPAALAKKPRKRFGR